MENNMIYKTLDDLKRVIAANKPQNVIDIFSDSYLTGVAIAPYLAAEKEYVELMNTEDRETKPQVLDDDGNVISEAINYNQIRDARIIELADQYPYLVDPAPQYDIKNVEYIDENGNPQTKEVVTELPIPSYDERRPELVLQPELISAYIREYKKNLRSDEMDKLTVTTTSGKTFDADETSQTRMTRAIASASNNGRTEANWVLANNSKELVTLAELKEALDLALEAQENIWFIQ